VGRALQQFIWQVDPSFFPSLFHSTVFGLAGYFRRSASLTVATSGLARCLRGKAASKQERNCRSSKIVGRSCRAIRVMLGAIFAI
jgi:hypothetical protein